MKIKKLFCLLTTAVISATALASNAFAYYDGTDSMGFAPRTKIGSFTYVLKDYAQYGSVKIPYSATVTGIPNIEKVEIPEKFTYNGTEFTVTDLDLQDFYNSMINKNSKIEEIVLPESIYNITDFYGFGNLKKMNIPKNTVIGRYPNNYYAGQLVYTNQDFDDLSHMSYLEHCPKLSLSVDSNNPHYSYKNDMLLSKDEKKVYMSFNRSTDITIPDGVEEILDYGGIGFNHIKNVKLPNTLKYLGGNWSSITQINLPKGLKEIGVYAFANSKIKNITLPNSLAKIGGKSFYKTKLATIVIPDSVKEIGIKAFAGSSIKLVKFGKGLTSIGQSAFRNCKKLKSVTIPKSVKKINDNAFRNCKMLSNVNILSSNVNIFFNAFYDCKKLKSVTLNGINKISSNTFKN